MSRTYAILPTKLQSDCHLTDHLALRWFHKLPVINSQRLNRWILKTQSYDITFVHRKGTTNTLPDCLLRIPPKTSNISNLNAINVTEDYNAYDEWYQTKYQEVKDDPEQHPDYQIIGDRLYFHKFEDIDLTGLNDDNDSWKLVPKTHQISTILYQNHTDEQSAHEVVSKTFGKVSRYYFWPGYHKDIAICQNL